MRILILGAGKMGSFFSDVLSFDHQVGIYDHDPKRLRFCYNVERFSSLPEIKAFEPELVINAATVKYTLDAFRQVEPWLPATAMLSDISSVKLGLPEYYAQCGHPYVSTHPMFGPTFANLGKLQEENAIVISEGDERGIAFFEELYKGLGLHVERYTFRGHDEAIAYSLSIPFASSLVFGAAMQPQPAPGTTFKRHLAIARGLMSEDDYLLSEILFNPESMKQLDKITSSLEELRGIIERHDSEGMKSYLAAVREKIRNA